MLSIDQITQQEQNAQLPHFGLTDIDALVTQLKHIGQADFDRICVLITINTRPVFFHAGSQTTNENNLWIKKKANVVATFDHSSLFEKAKYADDPDSFYQKHALSHRDFTLFGGGFPIALTGTGNIGSLVVSGLTDEEDHDLAYQALLNLKAQFSK